MPSRGGALELKGGEPSDTVQCPGLSTGRALQLQPRLSIAQAPTRYRPRASAPPCFRVGPGAQRGEPNGIAQP
eukprot:9461937-Alexandrium_andersonii.AAC.1